MNYAAPQRLSANLKALRTERQLTQNALAERSCVSLCTVALLEKTPHNASLVTVERLARGLGVEPWELLR